MVSIKSVHSPSTHYSLLPRWATVRVPPDPVTHWSECSGYMWSSAMMSTHRAETDSTVHVAYGEKMETFSQFGENNTIPFK